MPNVPYRGTMTPAPAPIQDKRPGSSKYHDKYHELGFIRVLRILFEVDEALSYYYSAEAIMIKQRQP